MANMANRVCPFSNGSQFSDWQSANCERCKKFTPSVENPPKCELDYEIGMAYLGDGRVTLDIARRMGYLDHPESYNWKCGEVEWTEAWKAKFPEAH